MRNLKKILALVLAVMMTLSVVAFSASAADDADYTDAANHLAALQVMKGNEKGDLMLDNGVTRYQAALFFVQALTGETDVAVWNADKKSAYFADVPEYGTAIDHAYGINIIKGRGNGVYGYNDPIIYQDMLVMGVRALGYETEDMAYPYGFILAAQKLGLTDNVAQINYKAALTRGETAQIIWDMLQTEIAVVDPITDKILYPGEEGLTDILLGSNNEEYTPADRPTLLEDSGLAGGKIDAVIVDFVEADEDDEDSFDVVTVDTEIGEFDLAAADFGIDADTRKFDYLGLPVEIFISVDEEDFDQPAYDDGDAEVVFASFPEYTKVTNIGDEENIKVVEGTTPAKTYISLAGTKFANNKYTYAVSVFTEDGWVTADEDAFDYFINNFYYDTKDGYVESDNTYGQVAYNVIDLDLVDDEETEDIDESKIDLVHILYTPYDFAQYNVREINDKNYTVVGVYEETAVENLDGVKSNFVEYLVDGAQKVTSNTKSISNSKGEAALNVEVEGVEIKAGDFFFGFYNEVDNVLTVAANCGAFQTGRLTAQTPKNETVKINGTNLEVGFAGAFVAAFDSNFDADVNKDYIAALEGGKDNVKYIVVDGNVVYMEACDEASTNSTFDFAIVTLDEDIMADLLDMSTEKYAENLTAGLYVDGGEVKVAMMNKTTGKWELATVETFADTWDADDAEFTKEYDLADDAKYTDLIGETYKNADAIADFIAMVADGVVAVVDEADGKYTLAANIEDEEDDNVLGFFVYGEADAYGISFSDSSAKTNAITADREIDAARVTLTDKSVIVVIGADGTVGSRVGVQAAKNSFIIGEGYFLAADANLIVLVETVASEEEEAVLVADWAEAATANSEENWYVTTVDTGVEIEAGETEDDDYTITYTNLYDMKAEEVVASVTTKVESLTGLETILDAGEVLFKNASGDVELVGTPNWNNIITEVANDNDKKLEFVAVADMAAVDFADADTIVIPGKTNAVDAYNVNVKVITLDLTNLDTADYDFTGVVMNKAFTEGDDANDVIVDFEGADKAFWEYALDMDLVNEITEPTEGVLDDYIIDNSAEGILVPETDNDDYADAVEVDVELYGTVCVDDGEVTLVVYKLLK